MKTPREFWILQTGFHCGAPNYYSEVMLSEDDPNGKDWVHVRTVDPSYDKAVEAMVEALEFYADKDKYIAAGEIYDGHGNSWSLQEKASEALQKYYEAKSEK